MPDIKAWLTAAAGNLPSGGVVKPASLSNLEAMNALEMMDPQMDWGMHFSPQGRFDPGAPLTPLEVCWVMDEMAAREVAWLRGGALAQTVFTSLHYHNALDIVPTRPPNDPSFLSAYAACAALRAFVLVYAKGVELVWNAVCDGNSAARDGEDMWNDPYGVPIETSEGVPDVLAYVDGVVRWLSQRDEYAPVVDRLRFRARWIRALQLRSLNSPNPSPNPNPSSHDETFARVSPVEASPVPWAFDDVASLLRQNMPLRCLSFPNHEETWRILHDALDHLSHATQLPGMSLAELENHIHNLPEMLSIVRVQYCTILNNSDRDGLVDEWLAHATGQPRGVLDRFDREITVQNDRRSFALWRDIVAGNFILGLTCRLQNPPRRRRALQHLARTWSDQAESASRIRARGYPQFAPIVYALRARALDSDLAAALSAMSLRLLAIHERRAHWWWILRLTGTRLALESAGCEWARAWEAVAAGMLVLYTLYPTGSPSVSEFMLRHKIPLGAGSHPASPLWSAWEAAAGALDEAFSLTLIAEGESSRADEPPGKEDTGVLLANRLEHGKRTALEWLRRASSLGVLPPQVREDVEANIAALEQGGELEWEKDRSAEDMSLHVPILVPAKVEAEGVGREDERGQE